MALYRIQDVVTELQDDDNCESHTHSRCEPKRGASNRRARDNSPLPASEQRGRLPQRFQRQLNTNEQHKSRGLYGWHIGQNAKRGEEEGKREKRDKGCFGAATVSIVKESRVRVHLCCMSDDPSC